MKVELLISRATSTGSENRGDVVEVSASEAERMVQAGQAVLVRSKPVEKAVRSVKPEKARK